MHNLSNGIRYGDADGSETVQALAVYLQMCSFFILSFSRNIVCKYQFS